jgi:hypothetical protein
MDIFMFFFFLMFGHWLQQCRFCNFYSWTSTRTMTLGDAQEFTAVDNLAFLLVNQTFLGQAILKYAAPSVTIYTTHVPSIKAVSLFTFNSSPTAFDLVGHWHAVLLTGCF